MRIRHSKLQVWTPSADGHDLPPGQWFVWRYCWRRFHQASGESETKRWDKEYNPMDSHAEPWWIFSEKRDARTSSKWLCLRSQLKRVGHKTVGQTETASEGSVSDHSIGTKRQLFKPFLNRNVGECSLGHQEVFTLSTYKNMTAKLIRKTLSKSNTVLTWWPRQKQLSNAIGAKANA